jgi:energy-coupling factor transport system permease protein
LIEGKQALMVGVRLLPLVLVAILVNVLFNHRGSTILCYYPNGNPLTKESIIFGISASMMILASIFWLRLFHHVVHSDKLLYLFGKTVPKIALVLSMIFRFVPRMLQELKEIRMGREALGLYQKKGLTKIKLLCEVLLTEISLAFENSIEISMSMKMRGYHDGKRSFYSIFHFRKRDVLFFMSFMVSFIFLVIGIRSRIIYYYFYPTCSMNALGHMELLFLLVYIFVLSMPLIIEIKEEIRWKRLRSMI